MLLSNHLAKAVMAKWPWNLSKAPAWPGRATLAVDDQLSEHLKGGKSVLRGKSSSFGCTAQACQVHGSSCGWKGHGSECPDLHSTVPPMVRESQSEDFPAHLLTPGSQHQMRCTKGAVRKDQCYKKATPVIFEILSWLGMSPMTGEQQTALICKKGQKDALGSSQLCLGWWESYGLLLEFWEGNSLDQSARTK